MALSNRWKQVDHYSLGSSSKTYHVDAQKGATETVHAQNGKCLAMQDVAGHAQWTSALAQNISYNSLMSNRITNFEAELEQY